VAVRRRAGHSDAARHRWARSVLWSGSHQGSEKVVVHGDGVCTVGQFRETGKSHVRSQTGNGQTPAGQRGARLKNRNLRSRPEVS
jgi:hypothetical protein